LSGIASQPTASLKTALAHAARLLQSSPPAAEAQAREILKTVPTHPEALLLLGIALRSQSNLVGALEVLEPLAASQPKSATTQYEYAIVVGGLGRSDPAIAALRRALALNPDLAGAWRALGDHLSLTGDAKAADDAYARHIRSSVSNPQLLEAAAALCENRLAIAEGLLRTYLKQYPTDVAAIRMLAETGLRLGRIEEAEFLLARCLELAPSFTMARHNYATALYRANKPVAAIAQVDQLLKQDPRNPNYNALKAAALSHIGEYERSIEGYRAVLKDYPNQPMSWLSMGHGLKTLGKREESVAAYRKALELQPSLGEAYWSLANLKTYRLGDDDMTAMQKQIARPDIRDEDRVHLHFALGKAYEDAQDYARSFEHYRDGNALRRTAIDYDANDVETRMRRSKALFTPEFFREREGVGSQARDPIFIVGLPRAGSTLIEQILASHSAIEGTMELPDIPAIAKRLGSRKRKSEASTYPETLATLEPSYFKVLGEEFLARTRVQRKLGRPFFIDKMPNNFMHVGLIQLILPQAKIIDARRHPMGCCFSSFKQHFARGQNFTYDLTDLGHYYRGYVELMAHFDAVLPGKVHRVVYEKMIADPEGETRRLLDYCGLPFEEACLRFHENDRAVRTASSEQVRRPIFTEAQDHWRNYESWLEPLKSALGPVLDAYPGVPVF
jgi:tetratricopeptide (TPR) repeat protein